MSDDGLASGNTPNHPKAVQANRDEHIWLSQIPKTQQSRLRPKSLASVLDKLIIERGYAAEQSIAELQEQWRVAVGEALSAQSKVGKVQRGSLQIYASNSMVMSELDLCRRQALLHLQKALPDFRIKAIKIKLLRS